MLADRVAIFQGGKVLLCDRPETIKSTVSGLFRLTFKKEETAKAADTAALVTALQAMGLSDIKREPDDTLSVHMKADERRLLPDLFDWALKNGLTANISPIMLEDAYVELVR